VDVTEALGEIRTLLLDPDGLLRAVAAGHRRGERPRWVRAQLRPVRLKAGHRLQVVIDDGTRPVTRNADWAGEAAAAVDELLAEPFGSWYVQTRGATVQLRVTKRGDARLHRAPAGPGRPTSEPAGGTAAGLAHDRPRQHLLDPGDPIFEVIGGSAAKRRQVDAFLRALDATLDSALPDPLPDPLRVVDLGCGNAYLTFAAHAYLTRTRQARVSLTGVDVRADQVARNTTIAQRLGAAGAIRFVQSSIMDTRVDTTVDGADVVLALHACDTATDEALARAVRWRARWILAAPCCHHDLAAQLRGRAGPEPYASLTRFGVLRERFADTLTDALRAALLRQHGYRVDVVEFIDSVHTPRNLLIRARWTGAAPTPEQIDEYTSLTAQWQVRPALARLLDGVDRT
jgi:SAM-dependent methyltransferase